MPSTPLVSGPVGKRQSFLWKSLVAAARSIGVGAVVVMTSAACSPVTHFHVSYAPDFPRGGSKISVFGVFHDGQMNPRSWDYFRLLLPAPFHPDTCEIAYGDKLVNTSPAISSAVDDYVRTSGVTDELLDQFAPMAKGDAILLITVAGHTPAPVILAVPGALDQVQKSGRGQGPQAGQATTDRKKTPDRNVFEASASLFSVRLHRSVGQVDMTYSGQSVEEAFKTFASRVEAEMPNSTCSGWNWDVHLDDKRIRDIIEH
jgi:hypothetical protein